MTENNDLSEQKRKERIEEMKEKIIKLTGDSKCLYLGGLKSLEAQERFLKQVLFIEGIEERPLFDQLEKEGLQLIQPENLGSKKLYTKLWETINAMAAMGHYLSNTDHLSDRELYRLLWNDILRQPSSINTDPSSASCHIDILGGCSDEDLKIRLKYYADEDERSCWEGDFPEDEIPPRESLPYNRDRHLPMPANGVF